ncbi:dTMP kinase [Acuticoccus sp. M5D2P5]|uniref:dTMP kinase n=1 Tax=Acuticoccus kalidii TaxID=2910977 RepID=UPI001F19D983|nr:dTMP kinase [Acuticoccus kalidii]MCF3932593.1 dTMP kinase [Acuticoccus kalidii]
MKGAFITFEGGEGAGKSTQAKRLTQRLRARGCDVVLTREPGGSAWAERLRTALLTEAGRALDPTEQAMLFAAARADHVDTLIAPALKAGQTVICDRFADSTEAYQGSAGVPTQMLSLLRLVAVGPVMPTLTLILDIAPEDGIARARGREALDPFEKDDLETQAARRAVFLDIAAREPDRCVVFDASLPADRLAEAIWPVVEARLGLAKEG